MFVWMYPRYLHCSVHIPAWRWGCVTLEHREIAQAFWKKLGRQTGGCTRTVCVLCTFSFFFFPACLPIELSYRQNQFFIWHSIFKRTWVSPGIQRAQYQFVHFSKSCVDLHQDSNSQSALSTCKYQAVIFKDSGSTPLKIGLYYLIFIVVINLLCYSNQ